MKMSSSGIYLEGFNGLIGVENVDQNDVIFGSVSNENSRFNEQVKAHRKNQALKRKKHAQIKKQHEEINQIRKDAHKEKQLQRAAHLKAQHEKHKNRKFLAGRVQAPMGYDFTNFTGDPNAGNFGYEGTLVDSHNLIGEACSEDIETVDGFNNMLSGGFGFSLPKIKISAPKISAPKISAPKINLPKIAAPKINLKAPKIKIAAPKIPTLKQVGSGVSKGLKQVGKAAVNVAAAPIAAGAHVLKQAGGHKLESGLKAATGVSVTQLARGGDATISESGKAIGAVVTAPVKMTQKIVQQTVGHKGEALLDKTTGGTYSQAISVGNLPGRALAGQAITKKDWVEVASLAMKVAAVVSAGSLAGAAVMLCKQYAAKELSAKLGGAAGSLLEGVSALSSGDVSGAVTTMAQAEGKRIALAEATKKLGPEAGNILAIGSAAYTGGAGAAGDVATDIGKNKALAEVAKKTGLPINVIQAVQKGEVPSPSEMKDAMKRELMAAPDKLQAELKKIPEMMANAPEAAKKALVQKQELIANELANRDKLVGDLVKKHADELKNADVKIKEALDKTNFQAQISDKATKDYAQINAEYEKAKANPIAAAQAAQDAQKRKEGSASAPVTAEAANDNLKELESKRDAALAIQNAEAEKTAKLDAATTIAVLDKENMDNVYQAKELSASNGLYGVRTNDAGVVLAEYKEVLPQSKVDQSLAYEHPFLSAGLIPRVSKAERI